MKYSMWIAVHAWCLGWGLERWSSSEPVWSERLLLLTIMLNIVGLIYCFIKVDAKEDSDVKENSVR